MKILLAVDGSKYSDSAARFLTFLDLSPDDEITVFHALHWSHFLYSEAACREALKEIKKLFAPRLLDSALDTLKQVKAKISTAIVEGHARQVIAEKAREAGMDLIVMGARGTKGMESLLLGSVTRAVVLKSAVPVLVTKLPLSPKPAGPCGIKILFATDGSGHAVSTQEFLASIPFPEGSSVTVLNVRQRVFPDVPLTFVPELNERYAEMIEQVRESGRAESERIVDRARDYLGRRFENVDVLSVEGDPVAEILAASVTQNAGLIAVGCRGLTGMKGMLGSVSRSILSHSKCPVLIGKMCED